MSDLTPTPDFDAGENGDHDCDHGSHYGIGDRGRRKCVMCGAIFARGGEHV